MSDDNLKPEDDAEPEDDGHQDDTEPEDDGDSEPTSTASIRNSGPGSGFNALNSYFGSDYFKSVAGFDELFKPGGAWNAMLGNATKGLFTPELLEMFNRQINIGEGTTQRLLEQFGSMPFASISKNLAAGAALNYPNYRPSLTKRGTAYSAEMNSPADYFSPWEGVIENFADLQAAVATILNHHHGTTFCGGGNRTRNGLSIALFSVRCGRRRGYGIQIDLTEVANPSLLIRTFKRLKPASCLPSERSGGLRTPVLSRRLPGCSTSVPLRGFSMCHATLSSRPGSLPKNMLRQKSRKPTHASSH